MLYICIFSHKFDLNQTTHVHTSVFFKASVFVSDNIQDTSLL